MSIPEEKPNVFVKHEKLGIRLDKGLVFSTGGDTRTLTPKDPNNICISNDGHFLIIPKDWKDLDTANGKIPSDSPVKNKWLVPKEPKGIHALAVKAYKEAAGKRA